MIPAWCRKTGNKLWDRFRIVATAPDPREHGEIDLLVLECTPSRVLKKGAAPPFLDPRNYGY